MARMSIEDLFLRDPRVRELADELGWSKYEARGRLLDVFAVVYDRVKSGGEGLLTPREIDIAAEHRGLADAMVRNHLAVEVLGGLRICGSERAGYLATREESGRKGGVKSGETRRNKAKAAKQTKVTFEKIEAHANPPDLVPDLVPDPVSVPDKALTTTQSHTPEPVVVAAPSPVPVSERQKLNHDAWQSARLAHELLRSTGIDPHAIAWTTMPSGIGSTELAARTSELLERYSPAEVREIHERCVQVWTETARREKHLRWFKASSVYDRDKFWAAVETSPQQAAEAPRSRSQQTVVPTPRERELAAQVLAKITERTDVAYTAPEHIALVVARIREGVDAFDLRKVIAYLASPEDIGGRGWMDSPKMRAHLVPETLFGAEKLSKYLEPARAWYAREIDPDRPRKGASPRGTTNPIAAALGGEEG